MLKSDSFNAGINVVLTDQRIKSVNKVKAEWQAAAEGSDDKVRALR